MKRMRHIAKDEFQHKKEMRKASQKQLERIEWKIDGAVHLENQEEMQGLIRTAAAVQLAVRLQSLYLFRTIKEKYEQKNEYSSKGLQYLKTGEKDGQDATYYYKLFLQMNKLVSTATRKLDQEEQIIRNFISRAASQARSNYIRSILHEVNYESGED